jgi:type IV pilus assembly protein PilW
MNSIRAQRPMYRQSGVTLVELMISLLLGLLLTVAIVQVFVGNRVSYAFNDGLSRIQENARFSLDHIAYLTRMAGYKGCLSDVAIYSNLNAPTQFDFAIDLENGVQGHEAVGTGEGEVFVVGAPAGWLPALTAPVTGLPVAGSDVLIVRSVSSIANTLVSPFADSEKVFVSTPNDFVPGDILVASDCQKASIFQATDVVTGAGANVVHSQAGTLVPGNVASTWGGEQDYGLGSEVSRLQAHVFYVGVGANGRPALFQLRLQSGAATSYVPEALAEDIDTMQVRYGIDIDNDGAINSWETADVVDAGDNWLNVLSVEVTLLARSTEEYGQEVDTATYTLGGGTRFNPQDDRRLRQVFSTTIGLRNRLP